MNHFHFGTDLSSVYWEKWYIFGVEMGTKHQVSLYMLILEITEWILLEFFAFSTYCDIIKNYVNMCVTAVDGSGNNHW